MSALDVLERFSDALGALCDLDPGSISDGDTLVGLSRSFDRLEAVVTRATARFDADGGYEADGARSCGDWVATSCHLPLGTARRRVKLGRALRHLPATEEAWVDGEICAAHVGAIDSARNPTTAEVLARDEKVLVDNARQLRFGDFTKTLAYWGQLADPVGVEDQARAQHDSRRVHHSMTFDGRWCLDGLFDAIGGSIIDSELRKITDEFFSTDWAQAKAQVGERVSAVHLGRDPAQRRADALVEMATRSAAYGSGSYPHGGRRPEPLFTVLVGYETFAGRICELANGTVVTPGEVARWIDEAWVERVVFDGPSRVIDVGQRRRLFAGATRRAVQVRDKACFHPTCEVPADQCQVDHTQPWSAGGLTTQDNGRAACDFHNRQRSTGPPGRDGLP